MKNKTLVLMLMLCFLPMQIFAIIPQPQEVSKGSGSFTISPKTTIVFTKATKAKAKQLYTYLQKDLKLKVKRGKASSNYIKLAIDPSLKRDIPGAYHFTVNSNGITVTGGDEAGVFYGIQTLRQLLPLSAKKGIKIPAQTIKDYPRFAWRGLMLDVSRYFMDAEYVKRYLDMMAMHKVNTLHWHLIDDAGWRIEIEKYPKLTEVGAWRGEGKERANGGFYTKKQLKDIVKYAADRHIDIVPEIELPAHTLSSIAAYPHLGCRQIQHKVPERHFISKDLYCAGRDTTYEFLTDVMNEVFEIFPAKWVHIGGDEVNFREWKKCDKCQAKIKKEGLKNEFELQGYMTNFFEKLCHKNGRNLVGWDEIIKCGVSKTAGLMVWKDVHHAKDGARLGHPIIASYTRHTYFDTPYTKIAGDIVGTGWTPPVNLEKSYKWDPVPAGLEPEFAKNIIGANACLWTDQFLHKPYLRDKAGEGDAHSEQYVDKLTLPRLAGLAEVAWTMPEKKDFDRFENDIKTLYHRYRKEGWKFRLGLPKVKFTKTPEGYRVEASSPIAGGKVYYTTNGDTPTLESKVFTKPITIKDKDDFTAFTATHDGKIQSVIFASSKNDPRWKKFGSKVGKWDRNNTGNKKAKAATWEVTGLINKNAKYRVTFVYTGGAMRLDTDWVEILRNDQVIHRIDRHGFTNGGRQNSYDFDIKEYETGASFKVRAGIYGDGGNNSNGLVFIKEIK